MIVPAQVASNWWCVLATWRRAFGLETDPAMDLRMRMAARPDRSGRRRVGPGLIAA